MMKKVFVTVLLTGLVAGSANAAIITGSLDTSPTDAEVFNTDVIGAINVGSATAGGPSSAIAVTVNGVNFSPASVVEDPVVPFNSTIGNASVGQLNVASQGNADAFSAFDASGVGGSVDTVLSSIAIDYGTGFTFNLSELQIGTSYTLQVFLASGGQPNREVEFVQGTTSILTWDEGADGPSIATFTFLADMAAETLILQNDPNGTNGSDDPIISGFLFAGTAVPEPSGVCLIALGLLGITGCGRRRK